MADLNLDSTQLDRYSRHIIMDEVGPAGQGKLLESRVLCLGAGGLGSPVIQYLAAAGVGTLGIADDDVVERSNLQRQVIHGESDIGRPKVESAADFIAHQNPDIRVETHETRVTKANVEDLVSEYDIVVDGSDNFQTRFLLNDICTLTGTPVSHGAILRFEGQVATFPATEDTPCYRCIFPEAPPEGTVPNCATAGVLGVLPGTIGCIQATEAIKLALGHGESLAGRLLLYNAAEMTFDEVTIEKNPACPVCGEDGIDSIADVEYRTTCSVGAD
ncbi:SAMP-activating enzyme E1 [Halocatena marina]|uniref:HesA/MoeB/ThiF family protein n=1 Tax=Halocatena marina TaxID=2934937 RepID=A0ABD5YSW0_9EURY|nr:molybdopterin-synthase adenylyltransferase MoeB [Halocatena marina]